MIVCDSTTALLALIGALQPTPETLVTTPGQYYNLILRLRWCADGRPAHPEDKLHHYLTYLKQIRPDMVEAIDRVSLDPDPSVIQISDSSAVVIEAAELALTHELQSDAAFLFAVARHFAASLLFTQYHGDSVKYATVAKVLRIPIEFIGTAPLPTESTLRQHDLRRDRRRPVDPLALISVR